MGMSGGIEGEETAPRGNLKVSAPSTSSSGYQQARAPEEERPPALPPLGEVCETSEPSSLLGYTSHRPFTGF